MLAPLDVPTGDGRRFLASGVSSRELPLPLKWQRADEQGHDNSVIIGSLEVVNYGTVDEAITAGWIDAKCVKPSKFPGDLKAVWGSGHLFTDADPQKMPRLAEDIEEATLLLQKKVIGPSVDTGSCEAVIALKGSDEALTDEQLDELFWGEGGEDVELEMLFVEYVIAAATLVGIPAFAECRPFELIEEPVAITAAVRKTGWSDLPLADRGLEWDGPAAEKNVADDAGIGGDSPDWGRYAEAFLYADEEADPETKTAYGFQIADIIDGTLTIVPRAVFAVAGVLQGARGGTTIPEADQEAMKGVVDGLYGRMADEFDDPEITTPWAEESASILAAVTAAAANLINMVDYNPALFADPGLDVLTPITMVEEGGVVRVFGHVATHDVCHVGDSRVCTTAPVSESGYEHFNRYSVPGVPTTVGRITVGHGAFSCRCVQCGGRNDDHACLKLSAGGAIAHHDQLTTVAWVRAGEDTRLNAIWVAGVIDPAATVEDLAALSRQRVSGDWRPLGGANELVEVLSLAREEPGFPLPRVRMLAGQVTALTAAGVVRPAGPAGVSEPSVGGGWDYERLAALLASNLAPRWSRGFHVMGDAEPGYYQFDGKDWKRVETMSTRIDPEDPPVVPVVEPPAGEAEGNMSVVDAAAEVDGLLSDITTTVDQGDERAVDLLRSELERIF
jgi:hypothetical protein